MKPAVWIRLAFVVATLLSLGCGSTPPVPTPEAVKSEIQQLDENRERERMNKLVAVRARPFFTQS